MYTGHMTREEFGVNLFETISLISGLQSIRQQISGAVHRENPVKRKDLQARHDALHESIAKRLPTLEGAEMDQVLQRHPIVVTL